MVNHEVHSVPLSYVIMFNFSQEVEKKNQKVHEIFVYKKYKHKSEQQRFHLFLKAIPISFWIHGYAMLRLVSFMVLRIILERYVAGAKPCIPSFSFQRFCGQRQDQSHSLSHGSLPLKEQSNICEKNPLKQAYVIQTQLPTLSYDVWKCSQEQHATAFSLQSWSSACKRPLYVPGQKTGKERLRGDYAQGIRHIGMC